MDSTDLKELLENNQTIQVIVKPNSSKSEIIGIDDNIVRVNIKAPAKSNRANIEVIKFFSKLSGKRVKIITGKKSKKKLLTFL